MNKAFVSILLSFALLAVSGYSRSIEQIRKDSFTVGIRMGNAPFGYNENGPDRGYEYDFLSALSEQMGLRFRLVPLKSMQEGEDMLKANKIDAIMGSIKNTSSVKDRFGVSNPYYRSGLGIMTLASNRTIYSVTDLNTKYVGTTPESGADRLIESFIPKVKLEMASTSEDALSMLQKGDVEAVVNDRAVLVFQSNRSSGYRVLDLSLTEDEYVLVVNKQYNTLVDAVNAGLDKLRTTPSYEQPCSLARICSKYKIPLGIKPIVVAGTAVAPVSSASQTQTAMPVNKVKPGSSKKDRIDELLRQLAEIQMELQQLRKEFE